MICGRLSPPLPRKHRIRGRTSRLSLAEIGSTGSPPASEPRLARSGSMWPFRSYQPGIDALAASIGLECIARASAAPQPMTHEGHPSRQVAIRTVSQSPNQALRQTAGAVLVSGTSSSPAPRRCRAWSLCGEEPMSDWAAFVDSVPWFLDRDAAVHVSAPRKQRALSPTATSLFPHLAMLVAQPAVTDVSVNG